jgi:hypothetical protein
MRSRQSALDQRENQVAMTTTDHDLRIFQETPRGFEYPPATAAQIVACLQANPGLRAEVLAQLLELPEAVQAHVDMTAQLMRAQCELATQLTELQGLYAAFEGSGHSPKNPREAAQAIGQMHDAESELAEAKAEVERNNEAWHKRWMGDQNTIQRLNEDGNRLLIQRDEAVSLLAAERARVSDMTDERDALLTLAARHSAEILQTVRIAKFMQDCREKTAEILSPQQPTRPATDSRPDSAGASSNVAPVVEETGRLRAAEQVDPPPVEPAPAWEQAALNATRPLYGFAACANHLCKHLQSNHAAVNDGACLMLDCPCKAFVASAEQVAPPPVEPTETAKALGAIARAATIRLMDKNWSVNEYGNEVLLMDHGSFVGRSRIEAERNAAEALPASMLNYVSGAAEQAVAAGGEPTLPVVMVTDTLRRVVGQQEATRGGHKFTIRRDDGGLSCAVCCMPESYRHPCLLRAQAARGAPAEPASPPAQGDPVEALRTDISAALRKLATFTDADLAPRHIAWQNLASELERKR